MQVAPKMSLTSTGGAGFNSGNSYNPGRPQLRTIQNESSIGVMGGAGIGGPIRPPLYVPSKRDSGRGANQSSLTQSQN